MTAIKVIHFLLLLTSQNQTKKHGFSFFFKYSTGVVGEKMKLQDIYIQQAYCRPNKRIKLFPSWLKCFDYKNVSFVSSCKHKSQVWLDVWPHLLKISDKEFWIGYCLIIFSYLVVLHRSLKVLCLRHFRFTAYRQVFGLDTPLRKTGRGNRVVIPSCVIDKIRKEFP